MSIRWPTISRPLLILVTACLAGCQFRAAFTPPRATAPKLVVRAGVRQRLAKTITDASQNRLEDFVLPKSATSSVPTEKTAAPRIDSNQPTVSKPEKAIQQTAGWRPTVRRDHPPASAPASTAVVEQLRTVVDGQLSHLEVPPAPADGGLPHTEDNAERPIGGVPRDRFPIDLPTVLRLAGTNNWGVRLAAERVREAQARLDAAKVLWLPSLSAGIGYTKHDGQIQDTRGDVIDVSRNSLFVGGGAALGSSPLAGGSGGPARLQVDLSLADAIFEPLSARQLVGAEQAGQSATFNDTMLAASLAYYELLSAQGESAIARQNVVNAEEVLKLTEAFVTAGKGSEADTARARVEVSARKQEVVHTEMAMKVASAELARLLQFDLNKLSAETLLFALEENPVPVRLVDESTPLSALVARGQSFRPELVESWSRLEASRQQVRAERWRPIVPNIHLGASAGGFGGGKNDNLDQLDGRSDFDILAVWQLENLGFGTYAVRAERNSQYQQALLDYHRLRDWIATDVSKAFHQVVAERERIKLAETSVQQAIASYDRHIARIRGLEGLPLEALEAVRTVDQARRAYLSAVIGYNQAQLRLLRAVGERMTE